MLSHTIFKFKPLQKYFHPTITVIPMQFNREKYRDMLMYILSKCYTKPNLGKTVLTAIMYFIDSNHYELYGNPLTAETYIKSKRGIRPKHFSEVTEDLISKKQLFLRKEPYYNRTIHRYYPTVIPICKFSRNETDIMNSTINKFSNSNATSIIKYAKNDPPLHIAEFGENIDCRYVFSRDNKYSVMKNNFKNK